MTDIDAMRIDWNEVRWMAMLGCFGLAALCRLAILVLKLCGVN